MAKDDAALAAWWLSGWKRKIKNRTTTGTSLHRLYDRLYKAHARYIEILWGLVVEED